MTAVVFETPGLIDVRAFTIMGAHAKPNSANPIGYFGTGLKYAIAVLVRMGAEPVVWIGRDRFSFSSHASTFRGMALQTIKMRVLRDGKKQPRYYEMPYTTAYGKNWNAWQAFRELESNTRDEGGRTMLIPYPKKWDLFHGGPRAGFTYVVVDHPEFLAAAEKIDEVFLPRARREGKLLEVIPGESKFAYYRTMRAKDLGKPSLMTYNFLEALELTEDRTIKYEFMMRDVLARWVLSEAPEEQVEAVLTADDCWWEHGLEFPGHVAPSKAFSAVMTRRPKGLSRHAHSYWSGRNPSPRALRPRFSLFEEYPRPWRVDDDRVLSALGDAVFERPADDMDGETWDAVAGAIVRRLEVLPIPAAIDVPAPEPESIPAEAPMIAEDGGAEVPF